MKWHEIPDQRSMETSDGEQEGTIKKMMEEDIGEKGIKG